MMIGTGYFERIASSVAMPSILGIWTSSVTTSGRTESSTASACCPSPAVPTTFMPGVAAILSAMIDRTTTESSTTSTRISRSSMLLLLAQVGLERLVARLVGHELCECRLQTALVEWLGDEVRGARLERVLQHAALLECADQQHFRFGVQRHDPM